MLALSAYGYYKHVARPRSTYGTFWGAMANAMTTDGVTCTTRDTTAGRQSVQAVSLDLVGKTNASSQTTIKQNGTTVSTAGISTVSDDYVEYTAITLPKTTAADSAKIADLLHVWGKQARKSNASLFEQTSLGGCVIPLARLTSQQADHMVQDMEQHTVFQTDLSHPLKVTDGGVAVLRYTTTVPPEQYVPFMKRFADTYGLQSLNNVAASSYNGRAPESIAIDIEPTSDTVLQITFTGQDHTIQFSGYGKRPTIAVPPHTIDMTDLQQRLQSLTQS